MRAGQQFSFTMDGHWIGVDTGESQSGNGTTYKAEVVGEDIYLEGQLPNPTFEKRVLQERVSEELKEKYASLRE